MIDFKKIDQQDLSVVNEPWTAEEQKNFSAFLKNRKAQEKRKRKPAVAVLAKKVVQS